MLAVWNATKISIKTMLYDVPYVMQLKDFNGRWSRNSHGVALAVTNITWLIVYRGVLMDTNGRSYDFLLLVFLPFFILSAVDKEIFSQVYVNTDLSLLRRRTANLVWE